MKYYSVHYDINVLEAPPQILNLALPRNEWDQSYDDKLNDNFIKPNTKRGKFTS